MVFALALNENYQNNLLFLKLEISQLRWLGQVKKTESLLINLSIVICIILGSFFLFNKYKNPAQSTQSPELQQVKEERFGFIKSDHHFETHALGINQNLGDLLIWQGIKWDSILKLDNISKDIFSIRKFRAKKPFTIVRKDACSEPHCIVYEPNKFTFIKYFIDDEVKIEAVQREYTTEIESASGIIESSLWLAMNKAGLDGSIIDKMEDAMASSVDFYHTQKGDMFKLIFERKYIEGRPVDYGEVISAAFKNESGEHFAVFYENDKYAGFYDLEGRPTKSTFLRAPLKYSRISSSFNRRRFHPIKKRTIPHLGTDYAAPIGTPIFAVADGVIERAGYTKNNGKYVKIRHDDIYQTQYLHMHRFAKGIRKGTRVKQGEVIGQVGQTGLATGPHVCFRFWKYGRQVNHRRENFPPADPLPTEQMDAFYSQRDSLLQKLEAISYPMEENIAMPTQPST